MGKGPLKCVFRLLDVYTRSILHLETGILGPCLGAMKHKGCLESKPTAGVVLRTRLPTIHSGTNNILIHLSDLKALQKSISVDNISPIGRA